MTIFDRDGAVVGDPDLSVGRLEEHVETVTFSYRVDAEEQGHYETIAEYPETGGRDVAWVVDVPGSGEWVPRDESGEVVTAYDGQMPDDSWDKAFPVTVEWAYYEYVELTEEEAAEKRAEDEAAAEARLAAEQLPVAVSIYVRSARLPRQDAVSVSTLYPTYDPDGAVYEEGDYVRYGGDLYYVLLDHTSQTDWRPDATPSLYVRYELAPDGIRVWSAPTGAHDAFDLGERCHYPDSDGPVYVSGRDGNTSEPTKDEWWREE